MTENGGYSMCTNCAHRVHTGAVFAVFSALALLWPMAALAGDAEDMVSAMSAACIQPMEVGGALGEGLIRAAPEMEAKLLNGKAGRILRTENARVVIVAHDSGETCEVMGLGVVPSEFVAGLTAWAEMTGYAMADDATMPDDGPGGAYLAREVVPGFVQMFIQSQGEGGFIGITVSRVQDSEQAREVLGL